MIVQTLLPFRRWLLLQGSQSLWISSFLESLQKNFCHGMRLKQKQRNQIALAREDSDVQDWVMGEALQIECTPRQQLSGRKEKENVGVGVTGPLFYARVSWVGLPCSSDGRESACNAGDPGLIPGLGRSSGEGNGNPLQSPFLENPMDRGA